MERLKVMKFPPIFGQRIKVESEGKDQVKLRGDSIPLNLKPKWREKWGKEGDMRAASKLRWLWRLSATNKPSHR